MTREQIIRAWKDEEYRNSLSPAQRAGIPVNPAGIVDLADDEMQAAVGGAVLAAADIPTRPHACYSYYLLCKK